MTSVQLRYSGSVTGLDWLVEELQHAGLDPRFPPLDRRTDGRSESLDDRARDDRARDDRAPEDRAPHDIEVVLDLRHMGDEQRRHVISDPGGLEVISRTIARLDRRYGSQSPAPTLAIVGVQSNRSTAAAVVLKNPDLAHCTDVECACNDEDWLDEPVLQPDLAVEHQPTAEAELPRWKPWPSSLETRRRVSRFLARWSGG